MRKKESYLKVILIVLPVIFVTRVFGFIGNTDFMLPISFGSFWIADLLIIIAIISSFFLMKRRIKQKAIFKLILLMVFYFFVWVLINIISGNSIGNTFNGFRGIFYFLLIVPIVLTINNLYELKLLYNFLLIYVALSSFFFILGFYQILDLPALHSSTLSDTPGFSNMLRIYPAGEYLTDLIFFMLISDIFLNRERRNSIKVIILIIITFSLFLTFARSIYIISFIGIIIVYLVSKGLIKTTLFSLIIYFLIVLFLTDVIVKLDIYAGIERLLTGYHDFTQGRGGLVDRFDILVFKFNSVFQSNPLFGRGFDWGSKVYGNIEWNPIARSNHNGYVSLFVIGGFTAIIFFVIIFSKLIKICISIFLKINNKYYKSMILGLTIFCVLINIKAMVTDPYTDSAGSIVLALAWGAIIKLYQIIPNKHILNSSNEYI